MNQEKVVNEFDVIRDREGLSTVYKNKEVAKENLERNTMEVEEENIVCDGEEHTFNDGSIINNIGIKWSKHKVFKAEIDMEDPTLAIGMLFSTVQ